MLAKKEHIKSLDVLGNEMLPRDFYVRFEELYDKDYPCVKVSLNNQQAGDIIDDNSYLNDGYRYHDVFHYTFATLLEWSPCARSMLKLKRKSCADIDRIEDGARAAITEEAISLIIFNDAKSNNFYKDSSKIDDNVLQIIKDMTSPFEVAIRSKDEWEKAILKSYELFRLLVKNNGGIVHFNIEEKKIEYSAIH